MTMGKEPSHLVRLFKGKMVVHSGGKASGFKNKQDADSYDDDGVSLYHVRGTDELNTRAVQVEEVAGSLNSGDCFVLLTPQVMYAWHGTGANEAERGGDRSSRGEVLYVVPYCVSKSVYACAVCAF